MNSEQLREELLNVIKKEFPSVRLRKTTLKSGNIRVSTFLPNKRRNKRWMQLDANPEYLSIEMDHDVSDI